MNENFERTTMSIPTNWIRDWLFSQLQADRDKFVLLQEGAPPHWSLEVHGFLNGLLPRRRISGCSGNDAKLSSFYLFPMRLHKTNVCVPSRSKDLEELKSRITDTVDLITVDIL